MANVIMVVFEGVRHCVSALWDLQEMRFSAIFDDFTYFAICVIMAAVSCYMALRQA
nr:hypothetical protein PRUPE_8G145800 [Ipomoea batatas]GMD87655.1 hypothetical protein PRUPE_8G145800 [Ipomoea batatas]GMD90355.1 hypothetical protein PRUPE_8G145800 [Ipomoea batatas]